MKKKKIIKYYIYITLRYNIKNKKIKSRENVITC